MSNKQHNLSKLKHELYEEKRNGKKDVCYRRLTDEEFEFLKQFCSVKPHLFEIKKTFRPGFDVSTAPRVVKDIYRSKRSPVYKVLRPGGVQQCQQAGLRVIPYKYKIDLTTLQ